MTRKASCAADAGEKKIQITQKTTQIQNTWKHQSETTACGKCKIPDFFCEVWNLPPAGPWFSRLEFPAAGNFGPIMEITRSFWPKNPAFFGNFGLRLAVMERSRRFRPKFRIFIVKHTLETTACLKIN
jgi:hypothetical protein